MNSSFGTLLRQSTASIFLVTLAPLVVAVSLTLVQPLEYRSSFSVLLIEKSGNLDGYAAAKSAERLSLSLGRVIGTAEFANQVYQLLETVDVAKTGKFFDADEQIRRDAWAKQVETRIQPDIGLLKVSVYQEDKTQAKAIAETLAIVVQSDSMRQYLGGSQNVKIRVVDSVLTTKQPVRPSIAANVAAGLLLGLVASFGYLYLRSLGRPARPTQMSSMYQSAPVRLQPAQAYDPGYGYSAQPVMSQQIEPSAGYEGRGLTLDQGQSWDNPEDEVFGAAVPETAPYRTATPSEEETAERFGLPLAAMPDLHRSY